jgi:hypothetical protein
MLQRVLSALVASESDARVRGGASVPTSGRDLRRFRVFAAIVIVLAIVARWSTTRAGLMSDDFMHWAVVRGIYPGEGMVPFDMYAFLRPGMLGAYVDEGVAPWWSDGELYGTVLRPSASLLLWLDHTLAPDRLLVWHIHSLAWFAAALAAAAGLLRRMFPRPIAALALVVLACDASMIWPLAWLANRCVLVCATFGFAAMIVHLDRRSAWLEGLLVALAFSAGEYAIAIVAMLIGIELFSPGSWRARARALLPALVPFVLYLVIHKALGYGSLGTEAYVDPFETPLLWASWAASRVPELACSAFWSLPGATVQVFRHFALDWLLDGLLAESGGQTIGPLATTFHHAHLRLAAIGLVLATLALVLARAGLHAHERRSLWMLGLGAAASLLPVSVAPAHERLLVITQLGVAPLVAAVVVACVRLVSGRELPGPARRVRGWLLAPLATLGLGLGVFGDLSWGQTNIDNLAGQQATTIAAFTRGDVLEQPLGGRDVVLLNSNNQSVGLYGGYMLAANGWPIPASWRTLSMTEFAMSAARPKANVLELRAIQGAWLQTYYELFFRREDQPLFAGDVLEFDSLRVEILADVDGYPTAIRFTFPYALDDPRYLFLISTPEGLRRWPVPKVGGRGIVPFARLPTEGDSPTLPPPPLGAR